MPLHLIDLYNFKPPADLTVNREESQAIRINAAKTSLVSVLSSGSASPAHLLCCFGWHQPCQLACAVSTCQKQLMVSRIFRVNLWPQC